MASLPMPPLMMGRMEQCLNILFQEFIMLVTKLAVDAYASLFGLNTLHFRLTQ